MTLVIGDVPNIALVMKAIPKALTKRDTRNRKYRLAVDIFMMLRDF